jgi:hypothetical protein
MKAEDIIMLMFLLGLLVSVPLVIWRMARDKRREEEEDRERWKQERQNKWNN